MDSRRTFHQELEAIQAELLRLAALVCEAITQGTAALLDGDLGAAQALMDADEELDRIALTVEDRCYHQLALQQPMASDLRALVTAIRLTSELGRSGDLMVNVAKRVRRMSGSSIDPRTRGLLQLMGDEALRLYRHAIDAYADADEDKAAAVAVMDDDLDDLHRVFIVHILETCHAGGLDVQAAIQLALIGRFYERVGDHAVNIGEKVRYMVSGWMPTPRSARPVPG